MPEEGDENGEEERPVSEEAKARARKVFQRAHDVFKEKELKEDRADLLSAWRSFEQTHGSREQIAQIEKQMPRKAKKRRRVEDDRFEEYLDYIFPADDESAAKLSSFLQRAHAWKQSQGTNGSNGSKLTTAGDS